MKRDKLPKGILPKGSSPTFTRDSLPEAFYNEHALAENRWGALQVLEGSLVYVDLTSDEEHEVTAPDVVIIAPERPHKLRLRAGTLRCRVDFFQNATGNSPSQHTTEQGREDVVRSSFERCEASGDFAEKFYEVFLASSEAIAPLFANTDFSNQRKLLRASVSMLVTRDVSDPKAREMLDRIGKSHARDELNIAPTHYENWLESLCKTVRSLDPKWSESIEESWRARMREGIQLITAAY